MVDRNSRERSMEGWGLRWGGGAATDRTAFFQRSFWNHMQTGRLSHSPTELLMLFL